MKSLYLRKQKGLLFQRRSLRNLIMEIKDFVSNAALVMAAGDTEDKMQEIMKDGSEGKTVVKDTIEDLVPHIKKSLEDPNVKFVKVFRAKTINCITDKEEKKFTAEEEKRTILDKIVVDGVAKFKDEEEE